MQDSDFRKLVRLWLCFLFGCCGASAFAEPIVSFNRDIRPILSDRCYKCHGPDANAREADLRLDLREVAVESAIVPKAAAKSDLLRRIRSNEDDERMPPPGSQKEPLTDEQIDLVRRWIDQGANYERHWSLIPPRRPALPVTKNASWAQNPIDHFVLARLEREGLRPSRAADLRTLVRRVTLDLTGLPPASPDVEAFVNDKSPDAYEKVIDRLLRSKRYGEHLARYWLDAARYADTNGYQYDLEREQWVWRDWVINAFNTNMPFDEFTIEQMAGDLLPNATDQQRLATAFHRNHPITIEGGVIDEEYRTEYVADRVVTTSTVWLGMTFLCARCHDHKFDPIQQKEFYQFFAFFNQVPERGNNGFAPKIKVASPLGAGQIIDLQKRTEQAESRVAELAKDAPTATWEAQLAAAVKNEWQVVTPITMKSVGGAKLKLLTDKSVLASGTNPTAETYEFTIRADKPIHGIRLEALTHESFVNGGTGRGTNGNFVLSEFQVAGAPADSSEFQNVKIASAVADYSQQKFHISQAIDSKIDKSGWAVDGHEKRENRSAEFTFANPVKLGVGATLRIHMFHKYGLNHQIGRIRLSLATGERSPVPLDIKAIVATAAGKRTAEQSKRLRTFLLERHGSPELKKAASELNRLRVRQSEFAREAPATMVMTEMPKPRATHLLFRGEYDKPRAQVSAGTPAALPPMPDGAPKNRLGLARWLVMPNHPLTARVAMNRMWQRLFGTGIVKTTEDFGVQGEWPSHPELLDWLAVQFVESGWDLKAIQKLIVMSAAYRQSSYVTPQLHARDPENRLLARGPRARLDAEVIRDSALFVSGLLSDKLGGPSVFPYHPKGLWQEINNRPGYSRVYKQDGGEKLYRRSFYTFWKRTVPPPSMATFDAPEREFCVVRRSRTNTPLQAFVLMHDPQFVEAARHLAERTIKEGGKSIEDRISYGFSLCTSRRPAAKELEVLVQFYRQRLEQYRKDRVAAQRLLAIGESSRDESLDLAEHAAYTAVARMMLNLSEFITKG